jgi:hypothetical protein
LGQSGDELGLAARSPTMALFDWQPEPYSEPIHREFIDEGRAAFILGLPKEKLREICEMSNLGHLEQGATALQFVFTYEELYRLCRLLVGPTS